MSDERSVDHVVDRAWKKRRVAEQLPMWSVCLMGVAHGVVVGATANPSVIPGSTAGAVALMVFAIAVLIAVAVFWHRRAGVRGHTGGYWPSPHRAGGISGGLWPHLAWLLLFTALLLGRVAGAFDHAIDIVFFAIFGGIFLSWVFRFSGRRDPVLGQSGQQPPARSDEACEQVEAGELNPEVLELIVLQPQGGERRIAWCAHVLETSQEDIRDRIARGRRWLEFPATEVHDPTTAQWVRLTTAGRNALVCE